MKTNPITVAKAIVPALISLCLMTWSPALAQKLGQHDTSPAISTSSGQLVYVPVYPSIYYMGQKKSLELTVTLSIHNISPDSSITLESVRYFNKKGKLIKPILTRPRTLAPLETTSFVVNEKKEPGGVGANFLVSWRADHKVNQPVIQAIMITTTGSQGISFLTEGVPVKSFHK